MHKQEAETHLPNNLSRSEHQRLKTSFAQQHDGSNSCSRYTLKYISVFLLCGLFLLYCGPAGRSPFQLSSQLKRMLTGS